MAETDLVATDGSDRRRSAGVRALAGWAVLALAAGMLGGLVGGCDKEKKPTTQTIEPGGEVYYEYRDGPKRQVTDRRSSVPLGQRGAVVLRSQGDRFAPVKRKGSAEKVWTVDLLEQGTEGKLTARLRTHDEIFAVREAGSVGGDIGRAVRRRAADVATRVAANPLMWRVETDGRPVYLFGTLHRAKKGELEELAPQVQEAFRSSEVFVMETDLDGARKYVRENSEAVVFPRGESLREKLNESRWKRLVSEMDEQLPERVLRRFRPWVVVARLSTLQSDRTRRSKEFMDVQLRDWAKTLEKPIEYLEAPKTQIEAFKEGFGLPALRKLLDGLEAERVRPMKLEKLYERGDREALEKLMFQRSITLNAESDGYRELLVERNENWVPTIEEYIDRGGVFVAAGCAHFLGPDSVVEMLREKGYTVRRVP